MQHQALLQAPVPREGNGSTAVSKERLNPRVKEASGPGGNAGWRSLGSPGDEEARAEHKAGLGNQGSEGHAKPGWFGGLGGAQEECKGLPDAGNRVRVMEQLVQVR